LKVGNKFAIFLGTDKFPFLYIVLAIIIPITAIPIAIAMNKNSIVWTSGGGVFRI
jgi:hypothetical protein